MHLIISKKLNLVHGQTGIDRDTVRNAVNSGSSTTYIATSDEERDAYIERQTRQGFTVHVFEYANSFQSVTSVQSVKAA
jgi:spore coat polysaccharide biosynthesis protein SpsF (cytidylyltransferase family)